MTTLTNLTPVTVSTRQSCVLRQTAIERVISRLWPSSPHLTHTLQYCRDELAFLVPAGALKDGSRVNVIGRVGHLLQALEPMLKKMELVARTLCGLFQRAGQKVQKPGNN